MQGLQSFCFCSLELLFCGVFIAIILPNNIIVALRNFFGNRNCRNEDFQELKAARNKKNQLMQADWNYLTFLMPVTPSKLTQQIYWFYCFRVILAFSMMNHVSAMDSIVLFWFFEVKFWIFFFMLPFRLHELLNLFDSSCCCEEVGFANWSWWQDGWSQGRKLYVYSFSLLRIMDRFLKQKKNDLFLLEVWKDICYNPIIKLVPDCSSLGEGCFVV